MQRHIIWHTVLVLVNTSCHRLDLHLNQQFVKTSFSNSLRKSNGQAIFFHLQDFFEELVKFMSSGPSHVLVLTKGQADDSIIKEWRDMLGPPAVEDAKEQAPERCVFCSSVDILWWNMGGFVVCVCLFVIACVCMCVCEGVAKIINVHHCPMFSFQFESTVR